MTVHLIVLALYSLGLMALGLAIGRRVRGAADFFVAGRGLGPGLIFSTMLAANIGAGSTVGATGQGYAVGAAAWWWVGSAAIGSLALAFWAGPAMRRIAAANDLQSVGDFLEYRYDRRIRGLTAALVWIASLFILASQLIGLGWILNVVLDTPKWIGCLAAGLVVTVYFMAGGLLTSARVNVVQLAVKLSGFAVAVPLAIQAAGGWSTLAAVRPGDAAYWTVGRADVALGYLFAFAPAFVVSPGLLQKILGARDDRAVRAGVGINALGLFLYAPIPVVLGIAARSMFPALAQNDLALPMVLMHALPPFIGALGLAAVFSAEISAADAVLMILSTSFSQDLYKRFLAPDAGDRRVLRVARAATVLSGALGVGMAIAASSIATVITIFYTLITVSLFVPIVAGLFLPRTTARDAMAAISAGVTGAIIMHVATGGRGWGLATPALGGLVLAAGACAISHVAAVKEATRITTGSS
jgi:SSS family solute:Na+ symporter